MGRTVKVLFWKSYYNNLLIN